MFKALVICTLCIFALLAGGLFMLGVFALFHYGQQLTERQLQAVLLAVIVLGVWVSFKSKLLC